MKRSSCVSALLVGLSLTTATAALAAPPSETSSEPVKRVAQAGPGTGTSDPTAASGQSSTQTGVTLGTSTAPQADTAAQAPPEPEKKPAPRPFAGSSLFVSNSMTTNTIFRGQTQYANPTVESNLYMLPRYSFGDFQLRGRAILSYEYTNNDSSTYNHEPQLSDTTLQLFYRNIPKLPGGFQPIASINAGLPTSKLSRARTMVVSPGATLQITRGLENILGGEGLVLTSLTYSHPLYQVRTAEVIDPRPAGSFACVGGNNCSDLLSGTMNPSDTLTYALMLSLEWGKWNPAIYYLGATQWAYSPKEVRNPVDGTPVGTPAGFEPTSVRQTHYLSAWLDYNANSWFTVEVGYFNSTSALSASGQRVNPFYNRYGDSRVYLGFNFQLDRLVKEIQGGESEEAGVVRARNKKQPMWTF